MPRLLVAAEEERRKSRSDAGRAIMGSPSPKRRAEYTGHLQPTRARIPKIQDESGPIRRPPVQSSFGRQTTKSSAGKTHFGSARRFRDAEVWSPGPGAYDTVVAQRRNAESRMPSQPGFGFGTATRDAALKQYGVWSAKR